MAGGAEAGDGQQPSGLGLEAGERRIRQADGEGGGRCPLTGVTVPAVLRASHILPWADCTDAQRLDVHNGLLLSALWDAAFDCGLVSFEGRIPECREQ